ncbi:MAG: amidohydrolase family protein [Planctomycetales bacterium]|nr:amidohydrolase family protein [Planctomycetales bacterium]
MRIDSHHHFWNYSAAEYPWIGETMSPLRRDFGPTDLLHELESTGIEGVISVQARQTIEETEWLLELAQRLPFIRGVVGWLPLAEADVRQELERFSHAAQLKSIRHVVQDEVDPQFILGSAFNRGVAALQDYGLVYDILVYARQLPQTIKFVDRHPQQAFVLDHIAKPTIAAVEFDSGWADNLRQLAQRENVVCKFSGVVTEVQDVSWSIATLRPYWQVALEAFGPQRLMFGSDWPVCLLRSSYRRWVTAVAELSSELSENEQRDFWGENARRAYRL